MHVGKIMQISDTIHGTIKLSELEKQIISTPIFNRLHSISQNSTVYLTFPTNRTKRFEHSIGAMELCGEMFYYGICNADKTILNSFFAEMKEIINAKIDKILDEQPDKYRLAIGDENLSERIIKQYSNIKVEGSIFNNFLPLNIEDNNKFLFFVTLQAVRISALLHDIGHPPFSHITENALKNIWKYVSKIEDSRRTDRQKLFFKAMKPYFGSPTADLHEQIGNIIAEKVLDSLISTISQGQSGDRDTFDTQLFKIFVKEFVCAILQEKVNLFEDIHRIIDGAIDGDRLDYVCRDPINSGLDMGKIEYDRLISSISLMKNSTGRYLFCANAKTLNTVEDFFNRRWKLYKYIIFHHRVIKTDHLLQNCIEQLSIKYLDDLTKKDGDSTNTILPYDISGLWKAIKNRPSHKAFFYTLIQWDDNWLMTVLKKHYFDEYIGKDENIEFQLEELLANKKYYYSVVKKMEDFLDIDQSAAKLLNDKLKDVIESVDKILEIKKEQKGDKGSTVDIEPFLRSLRLLQSSVNEYIATNSVSRINGFVLAQIKYSFSTFFKEDFLNELVKEAIVNKLKGEFSDKVKDSIIVFKNIKTGVQETLSLYSNNGRAIELKSFNQLSKEGNNLLYDRNFIPVFYVYLLRKDEYIDYMQIKEEIGKCVGNAIVSAFKSTLEHLLQEVVESKQ